MGTPEPLHGEHGEHPDDAEHLPAFSPPGGGETPEAGAQLAETDRDVIALFALVGESLAGATHALLAADREAARALIANDEHIDRLYRQVERLVEGQLTAPGPDRDPGELRYLIEVLRMLPELERSGDLAEHVASRAIRGLGVELSPRARGMIERMGEISCAMWQRTADAYADRQREAADHLETLDDELDELHVLLTAEVASGSMPVPIAIEAALVARFYERLGDHAVNLAHRIEALSGAHSG